MRKRLGRKAVLGGGMLGYLAITAALWLVEKDADAANIHSFGDALWYTVVTLTTVGYGDYYPVSTAGKWLGLVYVLGSISVLGYLVGELTTAFQRRQERKRLGYMGTDFKHHVIIIGWDRFGRQVAREIVRAGRKLVIVTGRRDELELIRATFPAEQTFALLAEPGDLELLENAAPNRAQSVFLNLTDDTESLVQLLNLKRRFTRPEYIVAINSSDLKETFRTAGVRYIVSKNEIVSRLVASYVFEPDVAQLTEELMEVSDKASEYDLIQIKLEHGNPFAGIAYLEAFQQFKSQYNAVLMGLSRPVDGSGQYELLKNPPVDTHIQAGDYAVLMADGSTKQRLLEAFGTGEGRFSSTS